MHKKHTRAALIVLSVIIFLVSGTALADKKKHKEKDEDDLGIRHETIYDESAVKPAHGEYPSTEPGKSKKIRRAFENSPALIPHDLTGMLPIAETNNMCLGCHMPEAARAINATPLPKSHFIDMDTGKDLGANIDGKRYNCMQCHVPQVNIPEPIKNTFKPDFRKQKDMTSSSLLESLNEGVKGD